MRLSSSPLLLLLSPLLFLTSVASADWGRIEREINRKLENLPLGSHELEMSYGGGEVTVKGFVGSDEAKRQVESAILSVDGVDEVHNQLDVRGDGSARSAIAEQVRERISKLEGLGRYRLAIREGGGRVLIEGEAATASDARRITQAASLVPGVSHVDNRMSATSSSSDDDLAARVRATLVDQGGISLDGLSIQADRGIVTIQGARESHRDVDRILSIVLMVDGVKDVKSLMRVGAAGDNIGAGGME